MKLLLKHCDILAGDGEGYRYLADAYLSIDGSVIDYIGTEPPKAAYDREKDMTGKMLVPGLINCHGHTAMTLLRGVGSDLPLQEWLFEKMMPIEDQFTKEDIRIGNRLALLEMISTGTTSYSDMYFHTDTAVENAVEAGIKANLCRPSQCFDKNETYEQNTRAKESIDLFKRCNGMAEGRILIDFAIHAEYTNFPHIVEAYSADCKALGGRMHIHLSETKKEHDECVEKYGLTPAQVLDCHHVFDTRAIAAHCVWVTPEDMRLLAKRGVTAVHCPVSNLKLASGCAPVTEMVKAGMNVALGTDSSASNNNLDLFEEMKAAALMAKVTSGDPKALPVEAVLMMATVCGARAQGRSAECGVIELGMDADLILLDFTQPHLIPCHNVLSQLVYAASGHDVALTMVRGKILYADGKYPTLDIAGALKELHDYAIPRVFSDEPEAQA